MSLAVVVFLVLMAALIYWGQREKPIRVSDEPKRLDQVDERLASGPLGRHRMF
jgi:hypothetical protein